MNVGNKATHHDELPNLTNLMNLINLSSPFFPKSAHHPQAHKK